MSYFPCTYCVLWLLLMVTGYRSKPLRIIQSHCLDPARKTRIRRIFNVSNILNLLYSPPIRRLFHWDKSKPMYGGYRQECYCAIHASVCVLLSTGYSLCLNTSLPYVYECRPVLATVPCLFLLSASVGLAANGRIWRIRDNLLDIQLSNAP
ncbi:uncharacterized protein FOMMEDRAFT_138256 [Fomitiporia mediterranea MF3/22]|uniref:uncharacterized protein n=1 Tax=Fomitiporia mediterranea (strain MF3/22) TaxID=694068 RepID=UPI00044079DF|nr:uncharacterized protein FOMMEDRAFT_138256 [Fomitiporia mediterranea MF3/22]EJD08469.1 hypothetical protein FOMMEDRAFT_138256 [Fomitiporia mediterranea MF3/22]